MITSPQIRAARALLGWDQQTLADAADVSVNTVRRIELGQGHPSCITDTLHKVQGSLESNGVMFTEGEGPGGGIGEGVCLRANIYDRTGDHEAIDRIEEAVWS